MIDPPPDFFSRRISQSSGRLCWGWRAPCGLKCSVGGLPTPASLRAAKQEADRYFATVIVAWREAVPPSTELVPAGGIEPTTCGDALIYFGM